MATQVRSTTEETQSDSRCAARYMTSMRFRGSWFGKQEVYIKLVDGEMRVHVGDKSLSPLEKAPIEKNLNVFRPSESLVTVSVGDATINVTPHPGNLKHRNVRCFRYFFDVQSWAEQERAGERR